MSSWRLPVDGLQIVFILRVSLTAWNRACAGFAVGKFPPAFLIGQTQDQWERDHPLPKGSVLTFSGSQPQSWSASLSESAGLTPARASGTPLPFTRDGPLQPALHPAFSLTPQTRRPSSPLHLQTSPFTPHLPPPNLSFSLEQCLLG